jgi:hypothetical protein
MRRRRRSSAGGTASARRRDRLMADTGRAAVLKATRNRLAGLALTLAAAVSLSGCGSSHSSGSGASSVAAISPTSSSTEPAGSSTSTAHNSSPGPISSRTSIPAAGAAAAQLPPPCSLISAAEATASLGYAVTSIDSSADNDPDQISCMYLKGHDPVLVVLIRKWTLAHFTTDAAHEPGRPQPLAGVGTSAYTGSNEKGPIVFAWERGVSVAVNGVSPISADQVTFLAKVAVGQLDAPK